MRSPSAPCLLNARHVLLVQRASAAYPSKVGSLHTLRTLHCTSDLGSGNTGVMANAVSNGLTKAGINVKLLDCEFSTNAEVADLVKGCQGFAVGSPTLGGALAQL